MWSAADFAKFDSIETGADKVWIHMVGPLVGAIFAGVLFLHTHPRELDSEAARRFAKPREAAAPIVIEFVGTFLIAFTYACSAVVGNPLGQLAALSVGCMAAAQVYAGGVTSGAHYNPAVTLAVLVRRKLVEFYSSSERLKKRLVEPLAVMFMITQCVAALCAGGFARGVLGDTIGFPALQRVDNDGLVTVLPQGRAVFGELVATAVLAYVALHSFTSEKSTGNGFFGLSIGLVVCGLTGTLLRVTGAALSPAIGLLGLCTEVINDDTSAQHNIWIYWVACPVGAVIAAMLFHVISFDEVDPPHRIMTKNTALATLDPAEQHFHAYFAAGGAPGDAPPPSSASRASRQTSVNVDKKVRVSSITQGDFVLSAADSSQSVMLPPPNGPPPIMSASNSTGEANRSTV